MNALTLTIPRTPPRTPPQLERAARMLGDLALIRRPEFLVAEIPIVLVPALLTGADPARLRTGTFLEGLVVTYLLFNFGDMLNCLHDRDLDATYKPHLSRAVYRLGAASVRRQIAATAAIVVALTTHLAWQLDRWLLLPMVLVGLALGAAYSAPPVRLKGRGVAHLATLWTIIFIGPMGFVSMLLAPLPPLRVVGIGAAYATLQMGIILLNTAEDFTEDRAASVRTTIVALGLRRGMSLAAAMVGLGGASLLGGMAIVALPGDARTAGAVGALALVVLATLTLVVQLRARLTGDTSHDLALVRRAAKLVPLALTLVAWASLAVAYLAASGGRG